MRLPVAQKAFEGLFSGGPPLPVTSGLVLYLRADLGFQLGTGNGVVQWSDQSGQGNHCTQSTQVQQPVWTAGAGPRASQPALVFTGTNNTFLQGSSAPAGTTWTAFVVHNPTTNGNGIPFHEGTAGNNGHGFSINAAATNKCELIFGGVAVETGPACTAGAWQEWAATSTNVGPAQTFRVNGVSQVLSASNAAENVPGAGYFVGANLSGNFMFTGSIYLVLEYNRVLLAGEIASVESWISQLTGIF
jgi:Concanavalin A-like lectin/glucanases superfamily